MSLGEILVESKTNSFIQKGITFIDESFSDSNSLKILTNLLNRLYPQGIFDFFDRLNARQDTFFSRNFFSPAVFFPLLYILFISSSNFRVSNLALVTVLIGLITFYIGTKYSYTNSGEVKFNDQTRRIAIFLFITGLIFLVVDLLFAEGIPLFHPSARRRLNVTYTMIAQLIPPAIILFMAYYGEQYKRGNIDLRRARIYSFSLLFLGTVLISSLGFRTQITVILIGGIVALFLTGLIGFSEVMISLSIVGLSVMAFGYLRALIEHSPIGFFDVIRARIGLTMSVYDYLVRRFVPFGANKGYTLLASFSSFIPGIPGPRLGPRTIVARLFGVTGISMTSTMLGTIVLDLGIIGIIVFMFFLGHVLGTCYKAAKTGNAIGIGIYAVLIAYSIVGIETGLVDFNVLMMFALGYSVIRLSGKN